MLQTFLPKQMTGEELTEAVRSIIAEVGATSMKEMGKVMGVASKNWQVWLMVRIYRPK